MAKISLNKKAWQIHNPKMDGPPYQWDVCNTLSGAFSDVVEDLAENHGINILIGKNKNNETFWYWESLNTNIGRSLNVFEDRHSAFSSAVDFIFKQNIQKRLDSALKILPPRPDQTNLLLDKRVVKDK